VKSAPFRNQAGKASSPHEPSRQTEAVAGSRSPVGDEDAVV